MRNAIGNALLFNIVITVIILMIAFLAASLSYSKAYRVKNNIINIIENEIQDGGYDKTKVDAMLSEIGYRIVKSESRPCVDKKGDGKLLEGSKRGNYRYCVYEYTSSRGKFYGVTSYMYFDIPLIEDMLEFPIYGETKVFMDFSGLKG